ncbi:MAG: serine hydrolase domain-containing protein, partial [Bacteroidota bacterium]
VYSNTGFRIASIIIERISGQSLKVFAEENIFRPLGMRNTFFLDNHTAVVPYRATGYSPDYEGGFQINMSHWKGIGDGALQTNINDLLLWDKNFYDPKVGGKDLIQNLTNIGVLDKGEKINYGLGLFKDDFYGLEMISHSGSFAGYRSELIRIPSEKFSVACLCNLADLEPREITRRIAKIVLAYKLKGESARTSMKKGESASIEFLNSVVGNYRNESGSVLMELKMEKSELINTYSSSKMIYLGNDEFDAGEKQIIKLVRDKKNNPIAIDLTTNKNHLKIERMIRYLPLAYSKAEYASAAGRYFSEELNAYYSLAVEESELIMKLTPNIKWKLNFSPVTKTLFSNPYGVIMELVMNKNNKIEGFLLTFERSRQITFQKM